MKTSDRGSERDDWGERLEILAGFERFRRKRTGAVLRCENLAKNREGEILMRAHVGLGFGLVNHTFGLPGGDYQKELHEAIIVQY